MFFLKLRFVLRISSSQTTNLESTGLAAIKFLGFKIVKQINKMKISSQISNPRFDRSQLSEAHSSCKAQAESLCQVTCNHLFSLIIIINIIVKVFHYQDWLTLSKQAWSPLIVIDNTNVQKFEIFPYIQLANRYRYSSCHTSPHKLRCRVGTQCWCLRPQPPVFVFVCLFVFVFVQVFCARA